MKTLLTVVGFLSLRATANFGVYLNSGQGAKEYKLACNNAKGEVKYAVTNLPEGVQFRNGDTIFIAGSPNSGKFNINVRAEDESGQNIDQVITLEITSGISTTNSQNSNTRKSVVQPIVSKVGSNKKLSKIISTYSSTQIKQPDYSNLNKYPEIGFPKENEPEGVNPTVIKIFTQQAQKSAKNRNQITSEDLGLSIASNRYQNAIKGITNLLKIIDQARANRNKAQSQIQIYTQSYNDAVTIQRNSQNSIITLQTKSSQIISAINSLGALIQDLRNKINQTIYQRQALNKEKNASLSIVTELQNQKASLIDKLKGLDAELATNIKILSEKRAQSQSANDAVSSKEKQLASNQKDLQNTNIARSGAISDIQEKNKVVQSLRKKLQEAQRDLSYAKIKLSDIDSIRKVLPGKIADIQKELEDLRVKVQTYAADLARIQQIIDNLKGNKYPQLIKIINDLDVKIGSQRTKVSDLDSQLAVSQGPLEDFKAKLDQAQEDLNFVRNQKADVDQNLRLAYQNGNDANSRVAFAKQNLDAIIKRFRQQSKIVSDATLNLQRARAEQALSKIALDQFVAHYSDALPYTIVPHGNEVGMGTPWGNNPSGAALGPLKKDGNGAPGSFKINSWVNYLSSAYGAGVSPAFSGSITELYPFSFSSKVQGNNVINEGGPGDKIQKINCDPNKNENLKVASGEVIAIRADGFDVKTDDGSVYKINVIPCTNLNANTPGYKIEKGDEAIVKGISEQKGVISARQITCLDEK